jgi:hypothetical protein
VAVESCGATCPARQAAVQKLLCMQLSATQKRIPACKCVKHFCVCMLAENTSGTVCIATTKPHLHCSCDVPGVDRHHAHLVSGQAQLLHSKLVAGGERLPHLMMLR